MKGGVNNSVHKKSGNPLLRVKIPPLFHPLRPNNVVSEGCEKQRKIFYTFLCLSKSASSQTIVKENEGMRKPQDLLYM